ncbi:glycoside hydrolase [Exidia glandulosa HHB12029]|uniref:Glycoside hydrolase n=1 Tax=Exidia glandulosa HHB12029 TaxID=1314781 RepID=A0A165JPT2_EXIGL|nr:glycoside hydrolase [Exidia glandulosa HHB12029]
MFLVLPQLQGPEARPARRSGSLKSARILRRLAAAILLASASATCARAFDISRADNVVAYWGSSTGQKSIGAYCDDSVDTISIAFLSVYFGTGHLPELTISYDCGGDVFANSELMNCASLAADIKQCQAKGKAVTLSIGGSGQPETNVFSSDATARSFADQLWNLFLGGTSSTRPFGDAALDGINFNIQDPTKLAGITAFVGQLNTHYKSASKDYLVTADVSCLFPDTAPWQSLGTILNASSLDAVYLRMFGEGPCDLSNYDDKSSWNFPTWAKWATTNSPNKDVKLYFSALGNPSVGIPTDYVDAARIGQIAAETRTQYKSFGGVVYWDAAAAVANNNFGAALKTALVSPASTSTTTSSSSPPTGSSASTASSPAKSDPSSATSSTSSSSSPSSSVEQTGSDSRAPASPFTSDNDAPSKSSNRTTIILAVLLPILAILAIFIGGLLWRKRRLHLQQQAADAPVASEPFYSYSGVDAGGVGFSPGKRGAEMRQQQHRLPVVDGVQPYLQQPHAGAGPTVVSSKSSYPSGKAPPPSSPTTGESYSGGPESSGSQDPEQFVALQSEMGRVGMSMQALLTSLARLRNPPGPADDVSDAGATNVPPPRYDHV